MPTTIGDNPVTYINSDITGSRKYQRKWMQPAASLQYDVPFVKGLFLKSMVSYDWHIWDYNRYGREYQVFRYDEAADTYQPFSQHAPSQAERGMITRNQLLSQTTLGYDTRWGNHNFTGNLVWETQKRWADNFNARRNLILPIPYLFAGLADEQHGGMNTDDIYEMTNLGLVGTFHYDYEGKYLLDYLFRYDGSSKFAPGRQWGFFPSVAAAWRISEEPFFKDNFQRISQLKLRGSYGIVGDDGASSYQFISGYNYPTTGSDRRWFTAGYVFGDNFLASADNKGIPNPDITWFTARTLNLGVDLVAWNGLFGVSADYFSRKREGLLARRYGGIPTVVGAGLPEENLNSDQTYGVDLELNHRNSIGELQYGLKTIFSLARVKRLYVERGPIGSSWNNWRDNQNNRLQGVSWLREGDGQKIVQPGKQAFLYDLSKLDRNQPKILAAASRAYDIQADANGFSFTVKSPSKTFNAMRIFLPKKPSSVNLHHKGSPVALLQNLWDAETSTLLLKFENYSEGVEVTLGY